MIQRRFKLSLEKKSTYTVSPWFTFGVFSLALFLPGFAYSAAPSSPQRYQFKSVKDRLGCGSGGGSAVSRLIKSNCPDVSAAVEKKAGSSPEDKKPIEPQQTAEVNGQEDAQAQQGDRINNAAVTKTEDQGQIAREIAAADDVQQDSFKGAGRRASEVLGASRSPEEIQRAEADRRLVEALRERAARDKQIKEADVERANDKDIRKKLANAYVAQEIKTELKKEYKKTGLELAQLLQMAAVTMQAATAMNSIEGTNPAQSVQTFDPTKPVAPQGAVAGRSPASLGDKKATISQKSDESEAAANAADEKSVKDKETLAKIKAEVEAAEKRKKILGMRLKKGLRDKLNDKLAKGQGAAAVDAESLFDGSLHQGMALANGSDQAEESAAKNSAMSASSVFRAVNQAVSDGFSLAGAETDHEVGQLVAEAERDLSSEDMSSGVLGRESPSLFQRVHSVHQACQRQKCVLSLAK